MKKILSLLLSCIVCCTTVMAVGCKDNSSTSVPNQTVERLEMENSSRILTLGDKVELPISYNKIEGAVPTWVSSAPDIVSVDENGCVEALKVGVATVTVKYGTKQASCNLEVGLSGNVPVLAFVNNMRDEITLMKSSEFDFSAYVQFIGKPYYDGEIEYSVADESVVTVHDGILETKSAVGSTQVSVSATWRGQTVHAKTVKVNVISESTVLLNDGRLTSVDLYTVAEHEGENYTTTQTISSVFVSEDGTELQDYTLGILDEGVASLEKSGDDWIIHANNAGETDLVVAYDNKEFSFDISVKRPVFDMDKAVDYSLTDKKYFDEENKTLKTLNEMISGFENITSYELEGEEYEVENSGFNFPEGEGCGITLYNKDVGYRVAFNVYTMIIDELKDFEKIYAGDTETDIKGLYMLGKDIIEPNTVLTMPNGKVPNNFAGMFDGKGHVLSFTFNHGTQYAYGLFGKFLKGATIKNLALSNITKSGTRGGNPAGILCYEGSDGASSTSESTLENMFVDVKFYNPGIVNLALMHNAMWATVLKNVIVHVPEVPVSETYGAFARGEVVTASNAYVISSAPLYVTVTPTNFKVVPTLYADYDAMLAAGNDYTSFSAEYWDVTTHGVPVWKTLVEDFAR